MNYKKIYKDETHSGAYLFFGKEKYLMENAVGYLLNKYVKGSEAFNYTKFKGSEVKPQDIISACETYPVMNDKKLVLVKDVCDFLALYELKDSFYEFLDKLSDFVILIFWDTGDIKKTTKFYKYFKKNNRDIDFGKLSPVDANRFVKSYFLRKGKKINDREAALFIKESGYTSKNEDLVLLDLISEMDKIAAAAKSNHISESDIRSLITENIDTNIFAFLDAMMQRNSERALVEFHNLVKLGEEYPVIFYMIIRQVKNLLSYKILSEKNISQAEMMNKMGLSKFEFERKIRVYERNFSKKFLTDFYEELIRADEFFKTSSVDEIIIFETLIIKYCQGI
ncbi:DNA polymerase III subunit delta [Peptoniphilus grossensis]|uniref:DNA polymerase III subunit delta n=1 Tax=Peptoniphilus grossensis TaxID=1465756 RepID=UPI0002FF715C|nr:DNA polymerase III subunit delta [Peptoniphilus grossensis]